MQLLCILALQSTEKCDDNNLQVQFAHRNKLQQNTCGA